ncbi:hypothetical protein PoB_007422200 [Plakobranchus ocellatus]|uniref:Uncharacterized protein n=1 Tax=Plakobranchus ocellatus TaxID=259542 RepID=A0AAV4DTR7_9GAST|nr:hypothetical protein PoB_007422200 [Plakobranchus ocellatus]
MDEEGKRVVEEEEKEKDEEGKRVVEEVEEEKDVEEKRVVGKVKKEDGGEEKKAEEEKEKEESPEDCNAKHLDIRMIISELPVSLGLNQTQPTPRILPTSYRGTTKHPLPATKRTKSDTHVYPGLIMGETTLDPKHNVGNHTPAEYVDCRCFWALVTVGAQKPFPLQITLIGTLILAMTLYKPLRENNF